MADTFTLQGGDTFTLEGNDSADFYGSGLTTTNNTPLQVILWWLNIL